jgi:hypothetical protein
MRVGKLLSRQPLRQRAGLHLPFVPELHPQFRLRKRQGVLQRRLRYGQLLQPGRLRPLCLQRQLVRRLLLRHRVWPERPLLRRCLHLWSDLLQPSGLPRRSDLHGEQVRGVRQ